MQSRLRCSIVLISTAVALTFLFWWPLYGGAGFIGGDLYPYFFPQKAFYTDCLKAGRFPLWNDLTGFGYPVLGESQTGAAYPFHLLFYVWFDLNTAYNIEHLLHYVLCFVATWLFARRVGLSNAGAHLSAVVFTYGWFPPRSCLEWAIVTGAWMPLALWCVESFVQLKTWRYAIGLSAVLGVQLLAGHFHLAFITQLLVVTYFAFRLWSERKHSRSTDLTRDGIDSTRIIVAFLLALIAGAGLAAVQLLPTWELKQRSSRVVTGGDYDPAYGHIPPTYLSQLVIPWCWYSPQEIDEDNVFRTVSECLAPWHWFGPSVNANDPGADYDLDQAIQHCRSAVQGTGTNKVEAHCYGGMIPIILTVWATISWFLTQYVWPIRTSTKTIVEAARGYWLVAGMIALVYATGLLLPIGRHVPGFSFFRGPGRYGIVTTLVIALFAGLMLSHLSNKFSSRTGRAVLLMFVFGSTFGDLWLVSRMVTYTVMTYPPRIAFRNASEIRQRLLAESTPPRLLAPGPNVCNLLGVSCVSWYLGIAPAEYVDPQFAMPSIPKPFPNGEPTPCTPELLEWLSRSGVTHVLNFERLDEPSWQAELLWSGTDPFLNRVWGRSEPIYLYRFRTGQGAPTRVTFPGRAYSLNENGQVISRDWKHIPADSRAYEWKPDRPGSTEIVVTELQYPGWTVQQGNQPLPAKVEGLFRSVPVNSPDADVTWNYRPSSVYCGGIISLITLILLAFVAHMRFWHPAIVENVLRKVFRETN